MSGTTPIYALPYPTSSDPIYQGASQMQALAQAIEDLMQSNGVVFNGKVSRSGDSMTGNLTIVRNGAVASLILDSDPGQQAEFAILSDGVYQWVMRSSGADFEICRFDGSGGFLGASFTIDDATGNITITNRLTVNQALTRAVQVASAGITLDGNNYLHVLTGTTAQTFTLPPVSGNTGVELAFKNRCTAAVNLTIQRAGINQIWGPTGAVTSIAIPQHGSARLINDGTYWLQV